MENPLSENTRHALDGIPPLCCCVLIVMHAAYFAASCVECVCVRKCDGMQASFFLSGKAVRAHRGKEAFFLV